jgi:hypothetical protein
MKNTSNLCIAILSGLLLSLAPRAARAQEEQPDPGAGAAQPAPKRQVSRAAVKRLFQIIKAEPTVKDVQKAAVKHYELEPARISRLSRNARLKGLIPNLSASFSNELGNRFTNTKDGLFPILPSPDANPNPNFYKERVSESSDQLSWSVSASWELDRLVFAAESLDAKSLTGLEENLIREVTTLFFSRRRILASLILSPPDDDEEFFYELMRLDEITATLDAFTGGMFSKKAWNWEKDLLGGAGR